METRKKTKSFALTLTTRVRAAMLLIAMLCCATGAWADEVEIGDGTSTTSYVPIGTYYNYSITEQLYTADEIGTAGTITSISFHYTGAAAKDFPIAVYMANVDAEDLESEGISLADADEVFNGTLSVPAEDGWVTIELDTPFAYDGTSNLLIGINKGYVYYFSGNTWYCTATGSKMTRYNQNDGNAYDITATVPGQAIDNRPNIKIDITPSGGGVVYNKPTDLIVSDLTSTGATISWTAPEGSPTGYAYQYKKASDADWSAETSVNTTSVALSNLEPAKAYNFRVKAVYGTDGESKFVSIHFTTDCDVITTFPWTENFESYASGNFNHPCWVNEHIDGSGSNIFKISTGNLGGNSTHQLQLPDMSTGTLTKLVLPAMDLNGNYQFVLDVYRSSSTYNESYASEGIRVFVSADGQIEGATEIGFIPRQYDVSSTIVPAEAAVGWYTYELPIPMTGTCHLILRGESQYCSSTYMDNFVVELVSTCRKPTGVNASAVTKHSATIGWTSDATEWVVAYKADADEDFTEVPAVTENSYALTGLAAETTYTVKVRTNCGGGDYSDWTAPVNFTTPIAAPVPTNVVVSNVTKNSATVSWVSDATSFNVQYKATSAEEWQTTIATENSITITGLTPETEYQVQVQGNYGDLDGLSAWSAAVTFTTDVAFPAPTDLAVDNVSFTSAEISWTPNEDATGSVLEYANYANALDAGISVEYKYDNGSLSSSIGKGGGAFRWGVMFPAGSYTGNTLFRVSVYDVNAMTGSVTIYNDGDAAPANPVATAPVTFTGANDFIDIDITATIDDTKNVWVIVNNESGAGYPAATATDELGDANGRWVEIDGTWYDLTNVGVSGKCFMIHAEIGNADLLTWTTVENATSPYELTGLTHETPYTVRVKSIYAEGESKWKYSMFTTRSHYELPANLAVSDITATNATLSWTGIQEEYNVQYRTKATIIVSEGGLYDDFESGSLTGWTAIRSGGGTGNTDWHVVNSETLFSSGSIAAHSGTHVVMGRSYDGSAHSVDNWLITPQVTLGGSLSYWVMDDGQYHEHYDVYVSTTYNPEEFNAEAFTKIYEPGNASDEWTQHTVDLSSYAGQQGYIAFRLTDNDQDFLFIDDVIIGTKEDVPAGEWISATTTEPTLTISDLDPDTEYEWQVQGVYESTPTEWVSGSNFTTNSEMELVNDDSENEAGKKNSVLIADAAGKYCDVTLSGRTLYKDGEWNTICLPFDLALEGSPLQGATAKTLTNASIADTHVELTFGDDVTTLQAGVPYIIKWEAGQENIENPTFTGVLVKDVEEEVRTLSFADYQVQFIGYYDAFNITADDTGIYYMTAGSQLKATGIDRTLKSCRAYFQFSEEAQKARQFVLNFGDGESTTTGIASMDNGQWSMDNGQWYTVNGMKLDKKPTTKGVYIRNGRKVVIK